MVKTDGLQVHVSPGEELLGQKTGQKTVPVSLSGEPRRWREQHFPGHGRSPPPSSLVSHFDTWARDVERCGLILSFVRLKQPLHVSLGGEEKTRPGSALLSLGTRKAADDSPSKAKSLSALLEPAASAHCGCADHGRVSLLCLQPRDSFLVFPVLSTWLQTFCSELPGRGKGRHQGGRGQFFLLEAHHMQV